MPRKKADQAESPGISALPLPLSFEGIIGHQRPLSILKAAIRSGRLPHAYLFNGPPRIGKFTTAFSLAHTALCLSGRDLEERGTLSLEACGTCRSCELFPAGTHPDFSVLEPDGQFIKIKQIAELQHSTSLKPVVSPDRWFIIDEADRMNPDAGNRFLKTLEEPPGNCHFILVSSRPQALLPTLRSRCQTLRFSPPGNREAEEHLAHKRGFDAETARTVWTLSGGNLGAALEADPSELQTERTRFVDAVSSVWLSDIEPLFKVPALLAADQDTLRTSLDRLEIWLRDVLIARSGGNRDLLVNRDLGGRVEDWARNMTTERILSALDLIHRMRRASPRNLNPVLVM
ncbi:MAG TPA: DNA polymerase III subunit delta', partial [Nitrospiria bacterium]|nr:DNA polymerase III subunit delta' [Nitrospiria bacterium]